MNTGIIIRINGPIVEARHMEEVGMLEVVEVGELRLIGEVIRVRGEVSTIQVYEETSGLHPGEPVYCTGRPLSVCLGPGLLGTIYDGIQRPLERLAEEGAFIARGVKKPALDLERKWAFRPTVEAGDELKPGMVIGEVQETASVVHRVMVPPRVQGAVKSIVPAGEYDGHAELCVLEDASGQRTPVGLYQYWPVRHGRPSQARLPLAQPLLTGLRVVDTFFPLAKVGAAAIPGG
ncbi:MAG: V-type ATP synthase subunit A, partial [Victivallales bacterium]|nr:V-type ATP synthase subunit A [Victivallales bacterium]